MEAYNSQVKDQKQVKRNRIIQIGELNTRITKGRELLLSGDIDGGDFKTIQSDSEKQIMLLEAKLNTTTEEKEDLQPILEKAINNLSKLDVTFAEATTIKKRQIIGWIFPEKLTFEGQNFRTA